MREGEGRWAQRRIGGSKAESTVVVGIAIREGSVCLTATQLVEASRDEGAAQAFALRSWRSGEGSEKECASSVTAEA